MGTTAGAAVLLALVALLLVGGFVGFWVRDKRRADEESVDPGRTAQDPTGSDLGGRAP